MPDLKNTPKGQDYGDHIKDIQLQLINDVAYVPDIQPAFEKGKIYLLFCLEGASTFAFGPVYQRVLNAGKVFMIYNPDTDLPYRQTLSEGTRLVKLKMSLDHLHQLFVPELQDAPVFNPENVNRKYYEEKEIPGELIVILHQLFEIKLPANTLRLFLQGKAIEILSLFFSGSKPDTETCPFLNDEFTVRKIKKAKELLIQSYSNPPTITELAKAIGLNEFQLKVGFKEIYGNSPYQYLLDHKLEIARQLLTQDKMQVGEVADRIGYTNTSHFIAAFKRKYGLTPKKMMS
ncbi:MAG: helix-turn-helix transcriptional regulator [Saprospiraceae bacterium]|nr:helix-turn-helix transcriptional regulator [Candidatus Vicinibacter affinis]MBK8643068.1 helix-turn-helix transcriptional regulator [Candidatus Vicinibacter affinis]